MAIIQSAEYESNPGVMTVRAHHLFQLLGVLGLNGPIKNPLILAKIARMREERLLGQTHNLGRHTGAADTIGQNGEYARKYEKDIEKLLSRFLHADPKETIFVTEGTPGSVCEILHSYGLGKHCTRRIQIPEDPRQLDILKDKGGDGIYLTKFLEAVKELGLQDKVTIKRVEATFTDAPNAIVRQVSTTVGVVKKVLQEKSEYFY